MAVVTNKKKKVIKKTTKVTKVSAKNPKDIEAGKDFSNRTYLTPEHKERATKLMYERDIAQKSLQITEQEVRNLMLEIRLMQEVNLVSAQNNQQTKDAAYKAIDDQVKAFLTELRKLYGINGDLKFNPASGKLFR